MYIWLLFLHHFLSSGIGVPDFQTAYSHVSLTNFPNVQTGTLLILLIFRCPPWHCKALLISCASVCTHCSLDMPPNCHPETFPLPETSAGTSLISHLNWIISPSGHIPCLFLGLHSCLGEARCSVKVGEVQILRLWASNSSSNLSPFFYSYFQYGSCKLWS